MINFIKRIWSGPISVKISLLFLIFVLLMIFIASPGPLIFLILITVATIKIIKFLDEHDGY